MYELFEVELTGMDMDEFLEMRWSTKYADGVMWEYGKT
jgi:hypothetical protein